MTEIGSDEIKRANSAVAKMLGRIRTAMSEDRRSDARNLARRLLYMRSAKIVACHRALTQQQNKPGRAPLPSLGQLVAEIGQFERSDPHVRLRREYKGNGRFRDLFAFDVLDQARQLWVKLAFELLIRSHPNQAGVRGAGSIEVMSRIRELVKTGEYPYAAEFDISNCFQSIHNLDGLRAELNLPEWAIREIVTLEGKESRHRIISRQGNALRGSSSVDTLVTTRGLPQGASVSPLFAYGIIGRPVLEAMEAEHGAECVVFNYCDNFLILGKSREAVERAHLTLISKLVELSVGPLALRTKTATRHLSRGIDFIGYRVRYRAGTSIIGIDASKTTAFLRNVREELAGMKGVSELSKQRCLGDLAAKIEGWFSAYTAACNDEMRVLSKLHAALRRFRSEPEIARLMRRLAARLSTEEMLQVNRNGEQLRPPRPGPTRRRASDMLTVPRGFSIRSVLARLEEERIGREAAKAAAA